MATKYQVQVIRKDRADWTARLEEAITTELAALGLHRSVEVEVSERPPGSDTPSVCVFLGSTTTVGDPDVEQVIIDAMASGHVVVPVVPYLADFSAQVPAVLRPVNGFSWDRGATALARHLLEELGIEEKQRRVFISHKRDDGLWAAEQAYEALGHLGFTPFIDRFCIRPGRRVQDTIADALEDHAFLLLLETPLAHTSDWVFDEVDYALSHSMGVLIVKWPGHPTPVPGSIGLPRIELLDRDLKSNPAGMDELTDRALLSVLEEVERTHAQGLCRRRRILVRSVEEAARASGCSDCIPLPRWRLRVTHPGKETLVSVTPRLPNALDLQELDTLRETTYGGAKALLVHSARMLRPELQTHLEWTCGDRDIALTPENAIGGWW